MSIVPASREHKPAVFYFDLLTIHNKNSYMYTKLWTVIIFADT